MDDARIQLFDEIRAALRDDRLVKLTLGAACGPDATLRNVHARPVALKSGPRLQLVFRHDRRDVTRNLPFDEALQALDALLGAHFRTAHVFTSGESLQLELRPGKPARLTRKAASSAAPDTAHDRARNRALDLDPRWLRALGVTAADGKPLRGMEAKLRQIHRFVEILSHLLGRWERGDGRIRLVDLGCGKGYLTFAAYQWLVASGWSRAEVAGIELRPALVETCNRVAGQVGYAGLSFRAGAIAETPLEGADVVVALHACDTATDDALAAGVEAGARLLVVAPCCHREVRPQLRPPPALSAVGAHGILVEREAELVTDALRAAALEFAGFDARVFEFVSTEHTAKNLMITAERREKHGDPTSVRALAAFFGVARQRLADRLGLLPA